MQRVKRREEKHIQAQHQQINDFWFHFTVAETTARDEVKKKREFFYWKWKLVLLSPSCCFYADFLLPKNEAEMNKILIKFSCFLKDIHKLFHHICEYFSPKQNTYLQRRKLKIYPFQLMSFKIISRILFKKKKLNYT